MLTLLGQMLNIEGERILLCMPYADPEEQVRLARFWPDQLLANTQVQKFKVQ